MLTDEHFLPDGSASDPKSQVSIQTSAAHERTYSAQAHEMIEMMAAVVINAQAGLNWLRAEPPDLERVRQALNSIAGDGRRAAENLARLRALANKVPTADGVSNPSADSSEVAEVTSPSRHFVAAQ
jgi:hypothetical protein